ncbi:MAG: glycosyltransferase family 39 protein, partial [Candidatus Zixiibacteriota bacterium]
MPTELKPSTLRSENGKWLLIIFGVALFIRVANLIFLSQNDPAFYFPQVDSLWHHLWAIDILKNNFWGAEVYFRGPLYPYFLALIYAIFGVSTFAAKIVQAIGGAFICVLIYQLGRIAFTEQTGRIAAVIAAFYGPIVFYESELLIEWLAILLALAMLLVLLKHQSRLTIRAVFFAGILGGLSAIARPNILVVYPLIALWLLLQNRSSLRSRTRIFAALAFTLGVILCILPVTVRNYVVGDDFVLISSQGGVNFHLANNPQADGLTMVMPEIHLNLAIPWSDFVDTTHHFAESSSGKSLKPSESSAFWNSRAKDYIFANPLQFLSLTGKRLVYLFSGFENSDQADIYRFREYSPVLRSLIWNFGVKFPFGIVAPLSIVGLVMAWRERRRLALLYIFIIGYIPTVILFLVTARHRLAVIVILILFAALAIERTFKSIRASDYR